MRLKGQNRIYFSNGMLVSTGIEGIAQLDLEEGFRTFVDDYQLTTIEEEVGDKRGQYVGSVQRMRPTPHKKGMAVIYTPSPAGIWSCQLPNKYSQISCCGVGRTPRELLEALEEILRLERVPPSCSHHDRLETAFRNLVGAINAQLMRVLPHTRKAAIKKDIIATGAANLGRISLEGEDSGEDDFMIRVPKG
ncbi:MAG: hypothetical protein JSW08_03425 [archaeon]|nr:MAG: hypothetical protein JSW08_03425 [archaeon]